MSPVVVVFRQILELPVVAANGTARQLGLEGPAGEGAGGFAHVNLGVGADAHAEQLQQFRPQFSLTASAWFSKLSSQ